jgi:GntR family transcriptional regulator
VRTIRYREIADDLRTRIETGDFGAARVLPSESELSKEHSASRVTVRKALELLRDEGLVDSRQGFGWFVATDPVRQSLGRLGTIEQQLAASGAEPERRVIGFGFVRSPRRAREVLGVDTVLQVVRLNLADGAPFAKVTVWCPEELGAAFSRDDLERSSFLDLLAASPVGPLGGATQTIGAGACSKADAELLNIPEGAPVLQCERITRDAAGVAVLLSAHVFPAHLTEFVVDLPVAEASISPSGLRLVE